MKKLKIVGIGLVIVLITFLLVFFLVGYFKPKAAGLLIETTPQSQVFLNNEMVGNTPFEITREPGEVVVKLVPQSKDLTSFETKIDLVEGIKTVLKREFGKTEEESSGIIISFQKETNKKQTSIAIISIPDASQVSIDGLVKGFTPFKTTNILPSDHEITITVPNYKEGRYLLKTVEGYKLTAIVKLAPDKEKKENEKKEEKDEDNKIKVEILDTPTGFLRVRSEPSTAGKELTTVTPGQKFVLLKEDNDTGWYKIESSPSGWISNQYSRKLD